MKKKKHDLKTSNWAPILFGIVAGLLLVLFDNSFTRIVIEWLMILIQALVVVFVHMLIHLIGCLVFGLLTGYRFISFMVLNRAVVKINNELRVKKYSLPNVEGQCLMSPPELVDGKIPYVLYNLGGSLFNFLFGLLFLILSLIFVHLDDIFVITHALGFIGLFFGLINIIPLRVGQIYNNGLNLYYIKKSEKGIFSLWLQLKVKEYSVAGTRLKDLDESLFPQLSDKDLQNPFTNIIGYLSVLRYSDLKEFEKEKELLHVLLSDKVKMIPYCKNSLLYELEYINIIQGTYNEREDILNSKQYKKIAKKLCSSLTVVLTMYAHALLCKKDTEKAAEYRAQLVSLTKNYPWVSEVESLNDSLLYVDSIYQEKYSRIGVTD